MKRFIIHNSENKTEFLKNQIGRHFEMTRDYDNAIFLAADKEDLVMKAVAASSFLSIPLEIVEVDIKPEVRTAAPAFMQKIDWELLTAQKAVLISVIGTLEDAKKFLTAESLDGILHIIDRLQDSAADDYGLPVKFLTESKEEK